jgi:serine/threonine protein phosphatase 1
MIKRTFVIGDVHGCALTLQHLIFKVIRVRRTDTLYLLGDLIDRGPRSRETLETILRLRSAGYSIASIRGNHEEMMLNACRNRTESLLWLENGGVATIESFNVEDACEIPVETRKFITGFPYYILLDRFILCHAGINCLADNPLDDHEAMIWSRDLRVMPERLGGRRLICGHTVQTLEEIGTSLSSERISLDNGCVFNERSGLGHLVALELETMTLYETKNIDV